MKKEREVITMTDENTTNTSSTQKVQRKLTNRHIQLIALGGSIGTGLFYGSASTIKMAGPAIALSYLIGGIIIFLIMRMLGEMCVEEPVSGSFSYFAKKYWGELPGFLAGWNYYTLYILVSMAELTAISIYINFWIPGMPQWLTAFLCIIIITAVNLLNVKMYGESESVMSIIKISAIIAMIVLGLVLIFSNGKPFPDNFSNLWEYGGFMPNGWWGMATSLVVVIFSFGGIELIGVTAAEVKEPEKIMPKAINQLVYRILLFYVGTMIVLMALFPWNQIGASGSPFVTIFDKMGISAAAHILNFVVLIAAISVYNSSIYVNSRMLYGMAKNGHAPKIFTNLSATGVPVIAALVTSGITLIAVILNYVIPDGAFMYVLTLAVGSILIGWVSIIITHLKFRKTRLAQNNANEIKFKSILYPLSNYIALIFLALVLVMMFIMDDMRTAAILVPIWLIILSIIFKITQKGVKAFKD